MKTYKNKNENYIIQQYKWKSSNIDMKLYKNKNKWNVYNAIKFFAKEEENCLASWFF